MLLSNDREKFFTLQGCRQKIVAVSHLHYLYTDQCILICTNTFMWNCLLLYIGKHLREMTFAIVEINCNAFGGAFTVIEIDLQ